MDLKVKVIKRYQNRKFYDTQQSRYVTLDDIAKMIRTSEEVIMIIDNKSKNDITEFILERIFLKRK